MQSSDGIYIGTSGWMYKDWGKEFYPPDIKKGHLSFLAGEFNTVEVNSSFYHMPQASTFAKWKAETPENFAFAVKLSRYITHEKKLQGIRASLSRFLSRAKRMQSKLAVVLVQLPPWLKYDEKVLAEFLKASETIPKRLNMRVRFALEPRHDSWMKERVTNVRNLLHGAGVALVFAHSAKIPSYPPEDENCTADFVYIRFHGPSEFAASRYGARRLSPWAKRIAAWRNKGIDVYAYFNNDVHGHAVHDARTLKTLVNKRFTGDLT